MDYYLIIDNTEMCNLSLCQSFRVIWPVFFKRWKYIFISIIRWKCDIMIWYLYQLYAVVFVTYEFVRKKQNRQVMTRVPVTNDVEFAAYMSSFHRIHQKIVVTNLKSIPCMLKSNFLRHQHLNCNKHTGFPTRNPIPSSSSFT